MVRLTQEQAELLLQSKPSTPLSAALRELAFTNIKLKSYPDPQDFRTTRSVRTSFSCPFDLMRELQEQIKGKISTSCAIRDAIVLYLRSSKP